MTPIETDVAIIGGGPIGTLLANLLGRRGHRVTVLEKQVQPYALPRAIHFDGEAMRCFQATGLAAQILPHTHVGKGMLFKDRDGKTLIDWSRDQEIGPMGWHESYRFYQPGLEQVLRDGLTRFDHVTLLSGQEVTQITQSDHRVSLITTAGKQIDAAYVIGADGTNSFTRAAMGSDLHDLGFNERWLVVDALLTRPRGDLGDHSIQFCDPDAPATYVRGVGARRRWELRLSPDDPETLDDAHVWEKLKRWITTQDATLERHAIYTFRSRIATKWQVGRCLIAGDAAHQMPPFMGQGMCAGVRDAANLEWKLSAVLRGANAALLNSYQSEREANARAFIDKSVALGRLINQTAQGHLPEGRMTSIWPKLGPGLGPRDGAEGGLAPQITTPQGQLADDAALQDFYLLSATPLDMPGWTTVTGAQDWLSEQGYSTAMIRPDGYCLAGIAKGEDPRALTALAESIRPALMR